VLKLVMLYTHPDDPAAFDALYERDHLPLLRTVPGLVHIEVARSVGSPLGGPPYYLITELRFADMDTLQFALASPGYLNATRALSAASGLATIFFAEAVR
jgi:uncharacterized protein (TIGR02118 family)